MLSEIKATNCTPDQANVSPTDEYNKRRYAKYHMFLIMIIDLKKTGQKLNNFATGILNSCEHKETGQHLKHTIHNQGKQHIRKHFRFDKKHKVCKMTKEEWQEKE